MIDKSLRKGTLQQCGPILAIRMTGGPDCLWLHMYLDSETWQMTCDSDIGSYAYRWGKNTSKSETFAEFCCRWMDDENWLLRKCIGERHVSKQFLREQAEKTLRDMVIDYNDGNEDFDEYDLDEMFRFASGYDSDAKAWALAIYAFTDTRMIDLPEEWYECIEEDYTPWQLRFAEICREIIVPLLKEIAAGERRLLDDA